MSSCGNIDNPNSTTQKPAFSKLHVEGNKIVNKQGEVVVLHGVAIIDPYFLKEVYNRLEEDDFSTLSQDWKATIVRVPVHPDLWVLNSNYLRDYIDTIVEWGGKYEMYILLDWHAQGNIISGQAYYPDWKDNPPWHGNPYNPDKALALSALKEMVQRYKDKFWVIYGTFNEPADISWDDWRPQAEELADEIHSIDPSATVMVSGVDFGYDLSGVLNNPVNRPNVIYETHPYPWKGEDWKDVVRELSKSYPVFVGEWGYSPQLSPGYNADNYGKPLVNLCKELNIGWTAWVWHDEWQPPMLNSLDDYSTTDFGDVVKWALNG